MNKQELRTEMKLVHHISQRDATDLWVRYVTDIATRVIQDDDIDSLLQWPAIESSMFVGPNSSLDRMYSLLLLDENTASRVRLASRYDSFCNPHYTNRYGGLCTNLIHQYFHLSLWEKYTGKCIEDASIVVEFGGGYGAMCRVANNLGFGGEYYIYDLPEISLIQQYYLSHFGIEFVPNHLEEYRFPVPPRFADIMIACWSISEVPVIVRDAFFSTCSPQTCLIAYQDIFEGMDNVRYFQNFQERYPEYRWSRVPHPVMPGQFYLIGDKT